jgi:hypoxanthine phosphoribosyltransferase
VDGDTLPAQVLKNGVLQCHAGVIAGNRHRPDLRGGRQRFGVAVVSLAHDRHTPRLQCVLRERRHVPARHEEHRAAILQHAGIRLGDHLKALHGARALCYSRAQIGSTDVDVLITTEDIQQRVRDIAADIARDHPGGVHLIAVLKGAFVFLSDLARVMTVPCSLDFMAVSSYGKSTSSSGQVQLLKDLDSGLEGREVVIVEDIVDTGLTLAYLQDILRARSPRSLRTACLLSKPSRRQTDVKVEYVGFTIEDKFVVGYGLDYAEQYRNLPYIAVLENTGN